MIQQTKRERNVFAPRFGAPLLTAYETSVAALKKREQQCKDDKDSASYKVFNAIFYSAIVRKEYANEKLRDALSIIAENKQLYRHDIKQKVRLIRIELAKWDSDIANCINMKRDEQGERNIEYYDDLNDYAAKFFDKLYMPFYYSILQLLTKLNCHFRKEAAIMETACALQEFMQKQLEVDVKANYKIAPPLVNLSQLLDTRLVKLTDQLRSLISTKSAKGRGDIDLNADPNTEQAAKNLLGVLGSAEAINNVVDAVFAPKQEEK